jgi:hypothetical protein
MAVMLWLKYPLLLLLLFNTKPLPILVSANAARARCCMLAAGPRLCLQRNKTTAFGKKRLPFLLLSRHPRFLEKGGGRRREARKNEAQTKKTTQ